MTDDQHGDAYGDQHGDAYGDEYGDQYDARHDARQTGGTPPSGGRWDPLPQGDYDDGATAFVKLPEGGVDALLASSDSPLAAPGHGYVPPQITVTSAGPAGTDPAATGSWAMPTAPSAPVDGTQWQSPEAGQEPAAQQGYDAYAAHEDPYGGTAPYGTHAGQGVPGQDDRFAYQPGATGQWDFPQPSQTSSVAHPGADAEAVPPASGQDVTGQWSIPVAGGDLPDESGEFTTSSLAEQWGTGAPATLPGGAPAPWATQPAGRPWGDGPGESGPDTDAPSARPDGRPWGDDATRPVPGGEERPAGGPHGPGSAEVPHAPGPAAQPHGPGPDGGPYGSDAADGLHAPGSAEGRHAPGPAAQPHGPGPDGGPYGSDAADGLHAPGSAEGVDGSGSAGDPHGTGLAGAPHTSSARGTHPPASADAGVPGPGPAGGPQVSGHADGGQQPGSVEGVPGPGPDAGPYASDPADGTTVAASGPARAAETVDDEPVGVEEAPEGPAEHSAHSGDEALGGSGPEAAEAPLAGPAPAPGPDHAPEPARAPGEAQPRPDDPAGDGTGPADADPDAPDTDTGTGTGTGTDETRTDPADPEAVPAPVPVTAAEEPPAPAGPQEEHPLASYVLRVNGADRPVTDAWIGESLLYVLRERLGLAGAKDGCSQGECGACNVQVDGRLVASCLVPAVTSANSEVRTVEGLATDGRPSDVQRALARRGAVQCGFCVPGMAMTVHNLLEGNPAPTELEARQALCGNLCRCSGYRGVLEAVQEVVAEREAHADDAQAGPETDEPRIPHQAGPGAGGVNPSAFEPQPPPDARDATGPHDPPPYGDHGDHDNHGQDGGHA
ncbi:2Fe-2S iron-sulfur cluster-binding protein [Streptomyces sp. CS159]|uniref:2Fe-2S iron-sulfur cluster-binding protein n=1 Tax=Streptomyces sp. CS159 TaxID=1982762 RepID=UPI000B410194|nr:2Fe-2S iron-sulfur cluster-binding protein [Streptomyces sp. CS159]